MYPLQQLVTVNVLGCQRGGGLEVVSNCCSEVFFRGGWPVCSWSVEVVLLPGSCILHIHNMLGMWPKHWMAQSDLTVDGVEVFDSSSPAKMAILVHQEGISWSEAPT